MLSVPKIKTKGENHHLETYLNQLKLKLKLWWRYTKYLPCKECEGDNLSANNWTNLQIADYNQITLPQCY